MPTIEACEPAGLSAEVLEQELEPLTPTERIERAVELFAGRLVVASKCGRTSPVLLEKTRDLTIVNMRTHHEPLERSKIVTWYERESDFDFRIYDAEPTPIPLPLAKSAPDNPELIAFHRNLKAEAFQAMLDDLEPLAYLAGPMRWQPGRSSMPLVEQQGSVVAIRPVVDLSQAEAESLLGATDLPFPEKDFDPAKGHDQKQECGLNTGVYKTKEATYA
jgi:3'-phosphoadenosine 5'-phosphosulfate sulfotransferase (PAPS reductase)/FAD synthetase